MTINRLFVACAVVLSLNATCALIVLKAGLSVGIKLLLMACMLIGSLSSIALFLVILVYVLADKDTPDA